MCADIVIDQETNQQLSFYRKIKLGQLSNCWVISDHYLTRNEPLAICIESTAQPPKLTQVRKHN